MEGPGGFTTDGAIHTLKPSALRTFYLVFSAVYGSAIVALFYFHAKALLSFTTLVSFSINMALLLSDIFLAFMWSTSVGLRVFTVLRKEFPENLEKVMKRSDYPALDIFICTADPYKEPPMSVVSTALSVMAYDYPTEKLSVFVSDDGGSNLTLFAFMEAAKFARYWLPFCRDNNILERSPNAYFESNYPSSPETQKIKTMYENMKERIQHVVETGKVADEYVNNDNEREAFIKWTDQFSRQNHPAVIQVLLDNTADSDMVGQFMPNLVYVSREKSKSWHHHFKAGALNALLRVSALMTNAPIILVLDCDMYSNDPRTPLRVLCYYSDPKILSQYAFIQFPQRFPGVNKSDIYAGEFKRLFEINPMGYDGLMGSNHFGTGCFFSRRAFFGDPSSILSPEFRELRPDNAVNKHLRSIETMTLAHEVAGCDFENKTKWGSEIGYRYGSLVEDYYTGYRLHCEGWRSMFCNPERSAFLGEAPFTVGLLEVGFSKYSPLTFGFRHLTPCMALAYAEYAFWPLWSIPIAIYAFLPQLALLNNVPIFPKVSEPWFLMYVFLFLGSYAQDLIDFVSVGGTCRKWMNDQRMWLVKGLTSSLLGSIEYLLKVLGISASGFNVTSKVIEQEQSKRYEQGIFEFGTHSAMFVSLTMAALINLASFTWGMLQFSVGSSMEGLLIQMLLAGYGTLNSWPIYEAIIFRNDKGKLPTITTTIATLLACALYVAASFTLKHN
ncbi:hypothetical protein K2173_021534 [Erythroxylum novogranatense]|uniref:Cellulose synthase-like protein G3 n=1 Tax=Erythroxylum novogranatense TaxID=1862640 RepID=A0AAV8TN79_9ROSI|nr:hypothetical protein K2173_021534 [Erythroxylum novogranatense]